MVAPACILPCHVAAKKYVGDRLVHLHHGHRLPESGTTLPAVKAFGGGGKPSAIGADEVDMVINPAMVADGCWDDVAADIRASCVRSAAAASSRSSLSAAC
ncbi:MAG: hypothetical protein ACLSHG_01620 [Oscillospiraceae bacterium]